MLPQEACQLMTASLAWNCRVWPTAVLPAVGNNFKS
jgi:hypothetical protein